VFLDVTCDFRQQEIERRKGKAAKAKEESDVFTEELMVPEWYRRKRGRIEDGGWRD
jgi:hypothetical protein